MRSKRIEEDRTREIVDACERLYAATGFHAVSLRDIARETSMSRPSVYNYFRTKEEIFLALFAREYDRWNAALARLLARPGALDDAALADALARTLRGRGILLRLLSMNLYDMEAGSRVENLTAFKRSYGESIRLVRAILGRHAEAARRDDRRRRRLPHRRRGGARALVRARPPQPPLTPPHRKENHPMKTRLHALLALAALPLCGCAQDASTTNQTDSATMNSTNKALVAYFSATGTTKGVAERLAAAIGADLFEIVPETPYTEADLNWRDKQSRSSVEMNDRASRPAIAGAVTNLADYATVFVGYPIWWYREPSIVDTFVEGNAAALAGKTVVPFATSGGSGMGDSTANLQALAPEAKVKEGRRFRASVSADDLKTWASEF